MVDHAQIAASVASLQQHLEAHRQLGRLALGHQVVDEVAQRGHLLGHAVVHLAGQASPFLDGRGVAERREEERRVEVHDVGLEPRGQGGEGGVEAQGGGVESGGEDPRDDGDGARAAAERIGPAARALTMDISDEAAVEAGFAEVVADGWAPDVVVANAGVQLFGHDAPIADLAIDLADGAEHVGYCELVGTVTFPQFQRGVAPYGSDGDFEYDDDGAPIAQGELTVALAITIPFGEMPATGWPLYQFFHGSGGESSGLVDLGKTPSIGAEPVIGVSPWSSSPAC